MVRKEWNFPCSRNDKTAQRAALSPLSPLLPTSFKGRFFIRIYPNTIDFKCRRYWISTFSVAKCKSVDILHKNTWIFHKINNIKNIDVQITYSLRNAFKYECWQLAEIPLTEWSLLKSSMIMIGTSGLLPHKHVHASRRESPPRLLWNLMSQPCHLCAIAND